MKETLKQRTAKGLFWGALNSGTTQILNLVIGIFLGRLLSPSEYGVVGVLSIFTAIAADLQSSGFTQGLVNLHRPSERDYNAVFTFNVVVSASLYVVLFFSAPLIALFFHEPCLKEVSRFVFLGFFIASLSIAHGGYMTKNMMNREIAIIGFVALVVAGAAGITLAVLGYGFWALAWQQVTYIAVITTGRYICVPQRIRLTTHIAPVIQMAPFAVKILVTKIVNTLSNNILTVLFGRLYAMRQVGNYSQAYKWDTMASSLVSNTVGQIAQAVMVEAGGTDGEEPLVRQRRVFRKMMRFTVFLSMPLMFGFAIVADEFILLTIKDQWRDCVPLLRVLCVSGAFLPLYTMYQNLSISCRRSDIYMWINVMQIVMMFVIVGSTWRYGMLTMVSLYSLLMTLWLAVWHHYAGRLISYTWRQMLADVLPPALAAAAVMTLTYLITLPMSSLWLLLLSRIAIAAVLYYLVMKAMRNEILEECERFLIRRR
ncbi:MAG: lipopolysaccharide biosynthesis protein [Prevotella sp.]